MTAAIKTNMWRFPNPGFLYYVICVLLVCRQLRAQNSTSMMSMVELASSMQVDSSASMAPLLSDSAAPPSVSATASASDETTMMAPVLTPSAASATDSAVPPSPSTSQFSEPVTSSSEMALFPSETSSQAEFESSVMISETSSVTMATSSSSSLSSSSIMLPDPSSVVLSQTPTVTSPPGVPPAPFPVGVVAGVVGGIVGVALLGLVVGLLCCCCCCKPRYKERYQQYSITTRYWDNTTGVSAHYQAGGSLRSINRNASLRSSLGLRPKVGGQNGDYIANPTAELYSTPL